MWKQFLPIGVFTTIFLGSGLILTFLGFDFAFYKVSALVCVMPAILCGLVLLGRGSWEQRIDDFAKGLADKGVALMILVFFVAGGFSSAVKYIGGVDAAVMLIKSCSTGVGVLPVTFLLSCFLSLSLGTSMGVIALVAPFAVEIAGADVALQIWLVGAVVGGAAFGDNLSLVSDTSIAASQTLGVSPLHKFKENAKVAIPATIITVLLYVFCSQKGGAASFSEALPSGVDIVKVLPYVLVIVLSFLRVPVVLALLVGALCALVIGLCFSKGLLGFFDAYKTGVLEMAEVAILSFFLGGLKSFIQEDELGAFVSSSPHKNGYIQIAKMGVVSDLIFANNTVAILFVGPVVKILAKKKNLSLAESASTLDIFATCVQCLIPYGAQLLLAASIVKASPLKLAIVSLYPWCLGALALCLLAARSWRKTA